jgi:hypothetical protein
VKDVHAGSLIFTVQILYGSATAAYQGATNIDQVVLSPRLGPYTFNTSVIPPPLQSNICFPAGTEISTDQGDIAIEKIVPGKHTIQGKTIDFITQTVTNEPYLIKLNKHALGQNKPSKTTLMSKDHKIAFEGQLVPAYRFLDYTSEVTKVRYTGERLYNVLMKDYGVMRAHNLICETLDPTSPIAGVYQGIAYKEKKPERKNFYKLITY